MRNVVHISNMDIHVENINILQISVTDAEECLLKHTGGGYRSRRANPSVAEAEKLAGEVMDIFRSVYCFLAGTITYYKNNFLREQFHRKKQQPALKSLSRKMNADPDSDYSFHHMVPLHLSRYVKDPNANSLITGLPNYHHVYTHDDIIADQLEGLNMSHEYPVLILAPRYKPLYMYSIDGAEDAIHRYQKQEAAALEKIYDFNNRQKSA